MKNSTKFVWIVLGAIAVILIVLTVMVRSIVSEHIVVSDEGGNFSFISDSGPKVSDDYNIEDFKEIRIVGGWDVLIIADDEYRVTTETRESSRGKILVEKQGETLYLGLENPEDFARGNFHGASATIYMPEIKAVDVSGAVNINVENFNADSLIFKLEGAGQIIGENCEIDELFIESEGAVNLDFSESLIKNAEVNINGAGNIQLMMNGGELTGSLAGLANLEYSGVVSRLDVAEDGISNVSRSDN